MLSILLGLIPGAFQTINGITNAIANEKIAGINAQTDQQRIISQERLATLQARKDLLLANANNPFQRWIMFAFGVGPAFLLTKIYIWDKALGDWTHGHTDKLDDNLWWVIMAQVAFYFLASKFIK